MIADVWVVVDTETIGDNVNVFADEDDARAFRDTYGPLAFASVYLGRQPVINRETAAAMIAEHGDE